MYTPALGKLSLKDVSNTAENVGTLRSLLEDLPPELRMGVAQFLVVGATPYIHLCITPYKDDGYLINHAVNRYIRLPLRWGENSSWPGYDPDFFETLFREHPYVNADGSLMEHQEVEATIAWSNESILDLPFDIPSTAVESIYIWQAFAEEAYDDDVNKWDSLPPSGNVQLVMTLSLLLEV